MSEAAANGTPSVTEDWVAELGDAAVSELIAEALINNQQLNQSAAQARAARERVGTTRAGLLPSITGSLSGDRTVSPGGQVVQGGVTQDLAGATTNGVATSFSMSWELDIWGRLTDQTRAAYIDADAAALDLAASQLSIAGATAQAHYRLVEARQQRQLSERDVATGQANLNITERRYNRGISSSLDVRLARSSLATSQATLLQREQLEREAARQLEVLLGRYPSASIGSEYELPQLSPMTNREGTPIALASPETLLVRRPDVVAAERRLKSAGLDASAARKALFPSLSLSGSARADGDGIEGLFDASSMVRSLAASISQPIFQGGRLRAQARSSRETAEAAAYTYANTALTAFQEVENSLAAEEFLALQFEAREVALRESIAVEELTNRQYLNGTTNIFNLIDAQQRRINAESQFIAASRDKLLNRIDLYLALGAPFEVPDKKETDLLATQQYDRSGLFSGVFQ